MARYARSPSCSPSSKGQELPQWISDVKAAGLPGLCSFATGLEQDLDAVTCGLTSRWNSGPVEGRVNHIKMIKRQMFGRAGLPLLPNACCLPPGSDRQLEPYPSRDMGQIPNGTVVAISAGSVARAAPALGPRARRASH